MCQSSRGRTQVPSRRREAIRAFEGALAEKPDDQSAKIGLAQAKALRDR